MNGILNIYKEKGYTSHDVVARLRRITGQRKIGHTGTLDPDAQGVLPVCLGRATKVCGMLTDKDKTYEAVLLLGTETDTQDITGNVLEKKGYREYFPGTGGRMYPGICRGIRSGSPHVFCPEGKRKKAL